MMTAPVQFQGIWKIQETPEGKAISDRVRPHLTHEDMLGNTASQSIFTIVTGKIQTGVRPLPHAMMPSVDVFIVRDDNELQTGFVVSDEDRMDFYEQFYPEDFAQGDFQQALENDATYNQALSVEQKIADPIIGFPIRRFLNRVFRPAKYNEAIDVKDAYNDANQARKQLNVIDLDFKAKDVKKRDLDAFGKNIAEFVESHPVDAKGNPRVDIEI